LGDTLGEEVPVSTLTVEVGETVPTLGEGVEEAEEVRGGGAVPVPLPPVAEDVGTTEGVAEAHPERVGV